VRIEHLRDTRHARDHVDERGHITDTCGNKHRGGIHERPRDDLTDTGGPTRSS
jgi:hypothetical protein